MTDQQTNMRERQFPVDNNFDGWRLDQFLCNRIPRLTRALASEICKRGDIAIEPPRKVKAGTKLRTGDVVSLREHLPPEEYDDSRFQILYEDNAVIAINKPSGVLVHETARVRLNTAQEFLRRAGYEEAEPSHRIDRETSGVLLCGKNKEVVKLLRKMFKQRRTDKTYRAMVRDVEDRWGGADSEVLDTPLGPVDSDVRVRMSVGKLSAKTIVSFLERNGDFADLEVRIETGRTHQIRVHLSMEGTPIVGDKLYTFDDAFFKEVTANPNDKELIARLGAPRHLLHAWKLVFEHPTSDKKVEVVAPLPPEWII